MLKILNLFSAAEYLGFPPEYPASVPPSSPALHENRDPVSDNCCSLQSPTTTACLPVNTASHIHPSQAGKLLHSTTSASQPHASLATGFCTDMSVCRHTCRHACFPDCTGDVQTPCLYTQTRKHMKALKLKGTAVKHVQTTQVCVEVTVGAELAPLRYDETLGCGHDVCRSTETGICGCLRLGSQGPRLSVQVWVEACGTTGESGHALRLWMHSLPMCRDFSAKQGCTNVRQHTSQAQLWCTEKPFSTCAAGARCPSCISEHAP